MNKKICNQETEVYSRVVGFYRPTKLWNKGKKEEYVKRVEFTLTKMKIEDTKVSMPCVQDIEIG
jgi:hypothetical protein